MSDPRPEGEDHHFPKPPKWATWICRLFLRISGWKLEGTLPPGHTRGVLIAVPHTSNWDFVFALPMCWASRIKPSFFGKDAIFRWPFGYFLQKVGGISVDRSKTHGLVSFAIDKLKSSPEGLLVLVQPEGTRSLRTHWKSGFYHIAVGADVPIICCFLDFKRRAGGVGPVIHPTGNMTEDMDKIRAFYRTVTAKHLDSVTPMRLKEEDAALKRGPSGEPSSKQTEAAPQGDAQ